MPSPETTMNKTKIPIRELTYRRIETIESPDDLLEVFMSVADATPERITKETIFHELEKAWMMCREMDE